MARKQRSSENLRKLSEDLFYEFYQFIESAKIVGKGLAATSQINNAVIESFEVHARILLHFFYPHGERPTDVIAQDFLSNETDWGEVRPMEETDFIADFCSRVSKRIAHLSETRADVSMEDQDWGPVSKHAYNIISEAYDVFLKLVPAVNLKGKLLKAKRGTPVTLPRHLDNE